MRPQIVRFIINVLLFGLSRRYHQVNGFGFNFTPAAPPAIPLTVAANSPFPFPFPGAAPCGAAPFCPPPTIILASPFGSPPPYFPSPFPPSYPPPFPPYPYPPPAYPYPYPPPDPHPKQTLFATILNSLLSRTGKSMSPSPPPPPPPPSMQYPPQHQRIQVHVLKDSGQGHKKQNQHQNHWREEKPNWN